MLVRRDDEGALVIGQLSHAWLSGQLARAWGNGRFGEVEPREATVLGAEQHDIGWALFDLQPRFNPETGLPRSFLEITVDEHLQIWRDAPRRLMSQSLHAALLVSLHSSYVSGLRAHGSPEHAAVLNQLIDEERDRQSLLRQQLDLSTEQVERAQLQLRTWDLISLALCNGWTSITAGGVPTADGVTDVELREVDERVVTLTPWPFATARLTTCCEARRLAVRYRDEAELQRAFELAPRSTLVFTLVAPEA
jgi:hypothetical protein